MHVNGLPWVGGGGGGGVTNICCGQGCTLLMSEKANQWFNKATDDAWTLLWFTELPG